MIGHEYMAQQVASDHRDRLLAQAETHRVFRDAPAGPGRPSLVRRLANLLGRPSSIAVKVPAVRTPTPAPGTASTS